MSIPELEGHLDSLHAWLVIWTLVVAAGLFIEYSLPIFEALRSCFKWKLSRSRLVAIKKAKGVCEIVGGILVIAGVVAEGLIEFSQSRTETSLRNENHTLIAKLGTDSKQALRDANSAGQKAALADQVANDAVDKVKVLDTKLSSVEGRTTNLSAKLTKASQDVDEANRKANDELNARIKLEAQLINVEVCSFPRVLPTWSVPGKTSADPLKALAGSTVIIEYVADNEAQRAASNIFEALKSAKLNVKVNPVKPVNEINDGVEVQPYVGPMGGKDIQNSRRADDVANVLVEFLHSYNWQAQWSWPIDKGHLIRDDNIIPPGSVRIQVGMYPAVMYIPPPGAKELSGAMAKFRDEREKSRQESQRRMKEYVRKMFDSLPPDQRTLAEQRQKEFDERMEKETSKGDNPCKDFTQVVER